MKKTLIALMFGVVSSVAMSSPTKMTQDADYVYLDTTITGSYSVCGTDICTFTTNNNNIDFEVNASPGELLFKKCPVQGKECTIHVVVSMDKKTSDLHLDKVFAN